MTKHAPQSNVTPIKGGTVGWYQSCVHRGRHEMFSEPTNVSPGLAGVLLTQNPDNRRIRPTKLAQLVRDMKSGRWAMNGEAIIVAREGEINDGQHRLTAIVEANIMVPMLFTFGVERETRTTVDQGANRSASDFLAMRGVSNTNTLVSMTRALLGYQRGDSSSLGRASDFTAAEVLERAEQDRTLIVSAKWGDSRKGKMKRFCPASVLAFCHNVLLDINSNDGVAFLESLCSGEELKRGDPVFQARERLLGMDRGKTAAVMTEIIFRAWNAYRERRTMRVIPLHGRLPELV